MDYKDLLNQSKFFNKNNEEIRLNIGCGPNMFSGNGWINYDREDFNHYIEFIKQIKDKDDVSKYANNVLRCIDLVKNNKEFIFKIHDLRKGFGQHKDNSITAIYIGQVIEHLNPIYETPKLLNECYRILKPGGIIRLATPNLDILIDAYINNKMDNFNMDQPEFYTKTDNGSKLSYIMFGACGDRCTWDYYEGHMHIYNKISMISILQEAGFKDIEFYNDIGLSKDTVMAKDICDAGVSHSLLVEGIK